MELQIKAKHFIGTMFYSRCNCAIAKAAKEQYKTDAVSEHIDSLIIDCKEYKHLWYDDSEFLEDKHKAENAVSPDEIIRTIELIKLA